ncbi:probable GPI-anchored adhesin-like protein PGA55 isoform X1 [Maniola jurtina]|uniref:probable GPI-anchored adhesin-like protein PGA55 isoform X1 n=1 Tax=Maniola jurtina TaxID=191418 RepID=UPI001E68B819|nr:probable GPI-anchored adhesin-like protein PGA55 isoform X1 [Maniola jurtina]
MRKTSHDGADSSSITSAKDSDTKKSAASFNKMAKSSIKRKVQNFSHESDDGIIEPLLQTDKEKIEIANRSAKYLLNKSKTESLHEKDNKITDGYDDKCSVPIPVSSTSNMITNNVKESPVSTSYICGSAPIHNHMNTNIFSAYEASTGLITTKNHILVEIDNSKPGRYSPSPLIFTTAKIHTDSKTKVMEPVQVTPVPILSTIEGNGVKAGAVPGPETKTISFTKAFSDGIKVVSGKPEIHALQTFKDNTFSPTVTHSLLKSEAINDIANKSPTTSSSLEGSSNLVYKDIKLGQSSNTVISPAAAKLASSQNTSLKLQPIIDNLPTTHTNISLSDKVKPIEKLTCTSTSNNTSEKYSSMDKPKESFRIPNNMDNKISLDPLNLQNQENNHKINLESPQHRKSHFISKDSELVFNTSVSSNKKLQCHQINASNEATNESVSKILKTDAQSLQKEIDNNFGVKTVKVPKQETKSDFTSRDTLPAATKFSSISSSKGITTPSSTEIKITPSTVSESTHKVKSTAATGNLKPTLTGVSKDIPKSLSKSLATTSQTDIKCSKESTTSSKPASTAPLSNSKLTTISVSAKTDIMPPSSCPSQSIKTDSSIKCTATTVNTTLPSYIVSTSKTKIGSTLTSNTPAITTKVQIQKPLVNIHTTSAFATSSANTSPSTSAANGSTKHTNFSKQTKSKAAETIKKDGRA